MPADHFQRVCQDGRAGANSYFAIACFARFSPVAANIERVIKVDHINVHIPLEIPFAQAAIIGIGA